STWKPVTALAAMEEGLITPYENLQCTGSYTVAGHTFNNWDPAANAWMDLRTAVAASCDTYFYRVGYRFYGLPARLGPRLQAWASRFGFGASTGVDLSPERTGLLPTPDWRKATYTKKTDPRGWEVDRLWKPARSRSCGRGSSKRRTRRSARASASSAGSRSRSPARRGRRRRRSIRATGIRASSTSRGGAATGPPTARHWWSAR